ncbi:biorientation of chromosomes in cell division protein 1-like 1 [Latimeria chalumnae]|uniref:biorientation of chromosomes in cell division protein 1-like 1 n=1 Tax=Latimeria chalumnae TaxID=7897 RepID=UPI00313B08FF
MAGLPPGDPKLVSMIVNHLKSQGLFDQFRRDCLADVDTKPAYQNLRQRVDNFVSNHLSNHTWSPHLNKNQLRNNIRQVVLQSGMLESGVDRIISQVVDPKINHTFRPQVEKAVHEFLSTLNQKDEPSVSTIQNEERQESCVAVQGPSSAGPSMNTASDAMSILDTITTLNQEASAARALSENVSLKSGDRPSKKYIQQQVVDAGIERDRNGEESQDNEIFSIEPMVDVGKKDAEKTEDSFEASTFYDNLRNSSKEVVGLVQPDREILEENDDQKVRTPDKADRKNDPGEKGEKKEERKDKVCERKMDYPKKNEDGSRAKEDKLRSEKDGEVLKPTPKEKHSIPQKYKEKLKEEYSLEECDLDGLSDITVSSVHTSDLSSFEEESESEVPVSDSTEEGEITSDDDDENDQQSKLKPKAEGPRPGRQAYIHKPFLYSKYYSDSDDELTVEQRRQSIAKEKEERLLKRQRNRERLEEKRKQKAAGKAKSSKSKNQGKAGMPSGEPQGSSDLKVTNIKETLKEKKVLEKKVALSRRRKMDERVMEAGHKRKQERAEDISKEIQKRLEIHEKVTPSSSKDMRHTLNKVESVKPTRKPDLMQPNEESKTDHKVDREPKRKKSTSIVSTLLQAEGAEQDIESKEPKKQSEKLKADCMCSTDINTEELQKPKPVTKLEKHVKKESHDTEPQVSRYISKKENRSYRTEKDKMSIEEKAKHKHKNDKAQKINDEVEPHPFERILKSADDPPRERSTQNKVSSDDKADRKYKHRSEKRMSSCSTDRKSQTSETSSKIEESLHKDSSKKSKYTSSEKYRLENRSKVDKALPADARSMKDSEYISKHHHDVPYKTERSSEERCYVESVVSESGLKVEERVHKDSKQRSKSYSESRSMVKHRSRSENREMRGSDVGLHITTENDLKTEANSFRSVKKDRTTEEERKSKSSNKASEGNSVFSEGERSTTPVEKSQKDTRQEVKPHSRDKYSMKEKPKLDTKAFIYSKAEKKLTGAGHKSKGIKYSNKEAKEESKKPEGKEENDHENEVVTENKVNTKPVLEEKEESLPVRNILINKSKEETNSVSTSEQADITVDSSTIAFQKESRIVNDVALSEKEAEGVNIEEKHENNDASKLEENYSEAQMSDIENNANEKGFNVSLYLQNKAESSAQVESTGSINVVGSESDTAANSDSKKCVVNDIVASFAEHGGEATAENTSEQQVDATCTYEAVSVGGNSQGSAEATMASDDAETVCGNFKEEAETSSSTAEKESEAVVGSSSTEETEGTVDVHSTEDAEDASDVHSQHEEVSNSAFKEELEVAVEGAFIEEGVLSSVQPSKEEAEAVVQSTSKEEEGTGNADSSSGPMTERTIVSSSEDAISCTAEISSGQVVESAQENLVEQMDEGRVDSSCKLVAKASMVLSSDQASFDEMNDCLHLVTEGISDNSSEHMTEGAVDSSTEQVLESVLGNPQQPSEGAADSSSEQVSKASVIQSSSQETTADSVIKQSSEAVTNVFEEEKGENLVTNRIEETRDLPAMQQSPIVDSFSVNQEAENQGTQEGKDYEKVEVLHVENNFHLSENSEMPTKSTIDSKMPTSSMVTFESMLPDNTSHMLQHDATRKDLLSNRKPSTEVQKMEEQCSSETILCHGNALIGVQTSKVQNGENLIQMEDPKTEEHHKESVSSTAKENTSSEQDLMEEPEHVVDAKPEDEQGEKYKPATEEKKCDERGRPPKYAPTQKEKIEEPSNEAVEAEEVQASVLEAEVELAKTNEEEEIPAQETVGTECVPLPEKELEKPSSCRDPEENLELSQTSKALKEEKSQEIEEENVSSKGKITKYSQTLLQEKEEPSTNVGIAEQSPCSSVKQEEASVLSVA